MLKLWWYHLALFSIQKKKGIIFTNDYEWHKCMYFLSVWLTLDIRILTPEFLIIQVLSSLCLLQWGWNYGRKHLLYFSESRFQSGSYINRAGYKIRKNILLLRKDVSIIKMPFFGWRYLPDFCQGFLEHLQCLFKT